MNSKLRLKTKFLLLADIEKSLWISISLFSNISALILVLSPADAMDLHTCKRETGKGWEFQNSLNANCADISIW